MFELPKEKFLSIFLSEANEIIESLENNLVQLEHRQEDTELINEIFRAVHTLKGSAGTVGLDRIRDFTHVAENLLENVRSGKTEIQREIIDALLQFLDIVKIMLESISDTSEEAYEIDNLDEVTNTLRTLANLEASATPETTESDTAGKTKRFALHLAFKENIFEHGIDPLMFVREVEEKTTVIRFMMHTDAIPTIDALNPFICYTTFELEVETDLDYDALTDIFIFVLDDNDIIIEDLGVVDGADADAEIADDGNAIVDDEEEDDEKEGDEEKEEDAKKRVRKKKSTAISTVRVSTQKLDIMMNLVGELVIAQSRITQIVKQLGNNDNDLNNAALSLDRITREIQEEVMNIRMMPISPIFMQFHRFVRDISMEMGKDIQLVIKGETTEIDKNMLEQLSDPLKHIIRNSIDHGIEETEARIDKNKPAQGTIALNAYHQEGNVVIEVRDDGQGLQRKRIIQKAIERGLVKQDEELPENEVYNLIFQPGFSTADKVTDISGRGVGMDVVRVNMEKMRGRIEIETKEDVGTTFKLKLPLTLAIIEGITFSIGKSIYVMPLLSIIGSQKVKREDIRSVENTDEMINIRGEYIPLIRLHKLFNVKTEITDIEEGIVVVCETGFRKAAIFVDELLDQQQAVVKSLDPAFKKHQGIAGGTILGDGRIALIIDVQGLVTIVKRKNEEHDARTFAATP